MTPEFWLLLCSNAVVGIFATGILYAQNKDQGRRIARIERIFDQVVAKKLEKDL